MNKVDTLTREDLAERKPLTLNAQRRPPPRAIKVLLPVWGYSHVRQFLECGLPTLLAPGNVPALAAALPTEFVLLTSIDDKAFIQEHPAFKRLVEICEAKIEPIDHLITDSNYSTTITLAYTEAVRAAGEAMIDTCFFFLVSDYIVADGSLANALKRMQRGTSAVIVGNFQVSRESAFPWLQHKLATAGGTLALAPRLLMRWALNHLHPATLANMVNVPLSHNSHTNRLFWRIDGRTILGRFYLMHMLCVRPEVTDFLIGASCDYSFVPEMCPSGNVEAVTDSDEYLVIEMQPRGHEGKFLRAGPVTPAALAKSLSEWTTQAHRENARHSLIFHANDVPADIDRFTARADVFLAEVAARLKRKRPLPFRGHYYWRGAMAAFYDATGRNLTEEEWRNALGMPPTSDPLSEWLLWKAKYALMGRPPHVLPWHPAWPDFRTALDELEGFFNGQHPRLLMLSNEHTALNLALADNGERVVRVRCAMFMLHPERYASLQRTFDLCLLELDEEELWSGSELLDRIMPLMKPAGRIILFVTNRRPDHANRFGGVMAYHSGRFIRDGVEASVVRFVPANRLRWLAYRGMSHLRLIMLEDPRIGIPLAVAASGFLLALSFIGNLDSLRRTRRAPSSRGITSSFVLRLEVTETARVADLPIAAAAAVPPGESQYERCNEVKNTVGVAPLGLFANRIWQQDPARLAVLLARYKFVAGVLSGVSDVGEVGCGDAFGARIVAQRVPDVTVYDANPLFIEDVRAREQDRWPLRPCVHDIFAVPLPRRHHALFSLNMVECVAPEEEYVYVANLCDSLIEGGVLIIGMPSAAQLEVGLSPGDSRVNGKSGEELKCLLEKFFERVMLVSMCDEIVHTGLHPTADYLFAICTGAKYREPFSLNEWRISDGVRLKKP